MFNEAELEPKLASSECHIFHFLQQTPPEISPKNFHCAPAPLFFLILTSRVRRVGVGAGAAERPPTGLE